MLDLSCEELPNKIDVNGKFFNIQTDFRYWIKFEQIMEKENFDPRELFNFFAGNDLPQTVVDWQIAINQLMFFYANPNLLPKGTPSKEKLVDYIIDGEYIYSSFMQVYGIDLIETRMHWWKFLALFRGLTNGCKMDEIMQARSYNGRTKTRENLLKEAKKAWELPRKIDKEKQTIIDEIDAEIRGAEKCQTEK